MPVNLVGALVVLGNCIKLKHLAKFVHENSEQFLRLSLGTH
jgi:hypothetical protein